MTNSKIYEAKIKFNLEEISESEITSLLRKKFDNDFVQNGDEASVLVYLEETDMDFDEMFDYKMGMLLKGGLLGTVIDHFEVEAA